MWVMLYTDDACILSRSSRKPEHIMVIRAPSDPRGRRTDHPRMLKMKVNEVGKDVLVLAGSL